MANVTGPMSDDERREVVKRAFKGTPKSRDYMIKYANQRTRYQRKVAKAENAGGKRKGCAVAVGGLALASLARWRGLA
jgi:hypothetical protein